MSIDVIFIFRQVLIQLQETWAFWYFLKLISSAWKLYWEDCWDPWQFCHFYENLVLVWGTGFMVANCLQTWRHPQVTGTCASVVIYFQCPPSPSPTLTCKKLCPYPNKKPTLPDLRPFFLFSSFVSSPPLCTTLHPHTNETLSGGTVLARCGLSGHESRFLYNTP